MPQIINNIENILEINKRKGVAKHAVRRMTPKIVSRVPDCLRYCELVELSTLKEIVISIDTKDKGRLVLIMPNKRMV